MVALLATLNTTNNKDVWRTHVAFSNAVERLGDLTEEIDVCAKAQAAKDGATDEKSATLNALAEVAFEVAAGTRAFARSTGDQYLAGQMDFSASEITRGSDRAVISRCEAILETAGEVVDSLAEFQITSTKLKALEKRIAEFRAVQPKPRQNRSASSAATAQLPKLFVRAAELLKDELDGLAVQFKSANPAFYAEYRSARHVVAGSLARGGAANNVVTAPNTTVTDKAA